MATWAKTDTPGKFRVRASVGSDHNGTRRRPTKIIHGTTKTIQRLADAWEADLRANLTDDAPAPEADDEEPAHPRTFAEMLRAYIDTTAVVEEWEPHYRRDREAHLTAIEADPLGAVPMDELRREHLASHLATYAATNTRRGTPPAPTTIRARRVVVNAVVRFAIADPDTDVRGNPAIGSGKAPESALVEADIPTVPEFAALIDRAALAMEAHVVADLEGRTNARGAGYRGRPGYRHRAELIRDFADFALLSGMRRSEVCALRATDITHHELGATIHVRHSLTRAGKLKTTKTKRSRTITVPANAAAILRRRSDAVALLAMADEVAPPRNPYVFSMGWGDVPLLPDSVTKWWEALRGHESALEGLTLQHLRHSHASHLHHLGLHDKAIAEHMGHSVEVSRRTYNHVRPGADVEMAAAIGAAWGSAD